MAAPPRRIAIVDVPFDGYGRRGHQADAAGVLRDAGLAHAHGCAVLATPPIVVPPGNPARGPLTGLINEHALLTVVPALRERVHGILASDAFPVVVGGDCSLLLGTFPGVRTAFPTAGLLFVDGHEDTTPLDVSEDGEAANAEIGLLLGITGRTPGFPLAGLLPALEPARLAAVGQRDDRWRRAYNVASVRDLGAFSRTAEQTAADPARAGLAAAECLGRDGPWWLHVDVDVLDPAVMPAACVPGDDPTHDHGGLTWSQLSTVLEAAAHRGGCVGMSVAVYDPCRDPRREYAARIVRLIHRTIGALGDGLSDDPPRPS